MTEQKTQLAHDSLNLYESVVMGVAGTAPAYSMAATTTLLISSVGVLAPASLLYCGLIMFGIALAFMHLNKRWTNAGTVYAWVSQIFHPALGFLAGWSLLFSSAVFMVSGTIPAATATLALFSPDRVDHPMSVMFVAAGWLLIVSMITIKGIKPTSYVQMIATISEVGIIIFLILMAFIYFIPQPSHSVSWQWLSVSSFTPQNFTNGALIALFFFWGWDVTLNLSEETKDSTRVPGRSALAAMIIVILLFLGFTLAVFLVLTDQEIENAGTNVIFVLAEKLLPYPWSYMAIIAVLMSSVGTLETTILQFTRTLYAKGRHGILPQALALLHERRKVPWVATSIITLLGLIFLFLASFYPTVQHILKISVDAIALQVAFYYSLAGFACAWYFRKEMLNSWRACLILCCWPLLSALFLVFIGFYSALSFDWVTTFIGISGIVTGIFPLLFLSKK